MTPRASADEVSQIRLATSVDLAAIERLLVASGLPLDGVREALESFVVAEWDGEIVGVAGIEPCGAMGEHALLRSVAIAPAWRGKGLGGRLVSLAIALADQRGARSLYLLTTTAASYFPAYGFTVATRDDVPDDVKATAEFRGACPASATVMMRQIRF